MKIKLITELVSDSAWTAAEDSIRGFCIIAHSNPTCKISFWNIVRYHISDIVDNSVEPVRVFIKEKLIYEN